MTLDGLREALPAYAKDLSLSLSSLAAETVLNDERAVIPIGSLQKRFGVTLSLPSVVGRSGVIEVLEPDMSDEERQGLEKSAESLKAALASLAKQ